LAAEGGHAFPPLAFGAYTTHHAKGRIMYVCICNALTERRIRAAIRSTAPDTVAEVYAALGVEPQCGKCGDAIALLIDEELAPAALLLAAE
jgi:bacterioferritin-associated ferredoxin